MLHTAASPRRVLEAGKVYNLPASEARELLKPYTVPGGGGEWRFAEEVREDVPAKRIPAQPDPGDQPEAPDADDWEDEADDEE